MLGIKSIDGMKAIAEVPKVKRTRRRGNEEGLSKDGPSFVFKEDIGVTESLSKGKFTLDSFPKGEEFEEELAETNTDSSGVEEPDVVMPEDTGEWMKELQQVEPLEGAPETNEVLHEAVSSEVAPVLVQKAEEEKYAMHSVLHGTKIAKPLSVIEKLRKAVSVYNGRNTGIFSENVEVQYHDGNLLEVHVTEDGRMLMPNRRVYFKGVQAEWDRVNEVRIAKGGEIELDLGVSFTLPDGYEIEVSGVRDLRAKYGLELIGGIVKISRQIAMFPIVLRFKSVEDLAYVQRYQCIVQARLSQT